MTYNVFVGMLKLIQPGKSLVKLWSAVCCNLISGAQAYN